MKCPEQAHHGDKADQWSPGLEAGVGSLPVGTRGLIGRTEMLYNWIVALVATSLNNHVNVLKIIEL